MGRVLIVVRDANTRKIIKRQPVRVSILSVSGRDVNVSAPGYTPQVVTVYPDSGSVEVSLVPRFRAL